MPTILPTIEDADTTCPKDTTASSRNKPGLPGTPASPGPSGPPGRGRVTRAPGPFRSGRTPGRGRHCHVAGPAQRDPRGGGTGTTQISYGSNGAVSITRASASPTAISSNSASLTRPRTIPWPPRASPARPARRTFRPSRSLSLPMGNSSSRHVRPQMLSARPRAEAEWPRQRTTRMVRPIVPGAFPIAQNAHFGDSIGHRGIRWATDHIGGSRT